MRRDSQPLDLPNWANALETSATVIAGDEARLGFAIDLAHQNVEQGTGGPFGAAIFNLNDGQLLAIGVNSVLRLNSSVMHAEMMAIMRAQRSLGTYTLRQSECGLYTSCEPCAMCLGGILWSGVRRLVCGAGAASARSIGFDEGPVDEISYRHLMQAGIDVHRGILADDAEAVIRLYQTRGAPIYNG